MPHGFRIEYTDPADGQVTDITARVARFSLTASFRSYCRELTLEIADPAFYAGLDLMRIPAAPSVEVFTRTADTWYSQGRFYIERPAMAHEINSAVARGVWGRSETAALGEPFASRQSVSVETDTTFFNLAESLVTGAGLFWDAANSRINDFPVYAYTYARENAYPIDILSELAAFAGAVVSTDRLGSVRILERNYSPAAADVSITETEISRLQENPEWPQFGNRIRITPAGDLAGYRMAVSVPEPCMPADGTSARRIYARLTDADGKPVQNTPIAWQSNATHAALATVQNNTGTRLMPAEEVRAKNYYQIDVSFPPSSVRGVWAYADKTRKSNLAGPGYEISGNTIKLSEPLAYCDQLLIVEYFSRGVAVNHLFAGAAAEDVTVTASVQGAAASGDFYIGNACQCPPTIDLEAMPSRIQINESAALILYAEEAGPVTDGRMVYLTHTNGTALGSLSWGRARLGTVRINHERGGAKNEVAGVSQVEVSRYINAVSGVWRASEDGNPLGENLYAGTFSDKTVDLSGFVASGEPLVVSYKAEGAALCRFSGGGAPGMAHFRSWMRSNREAPVEDTEDLRIEDPSDPYGDNPDTEYGGVGGGGDGGDGIEPPETGFCTDENGDLVKCGDGEMCCYGDDGNIGCRPESECDSGSIPDPCATNNLSLETDVSAGERFERAAENGCSCEEACRQEMETYGTTQNFDDSSYRTIGDIAEQDYGLSPGSPEYNEKTADLESQALDECIAQCGDCSDVDPLSASEDNPEIMDPPGSAVISVAGGRGPFTWSMSGVSGHLESNQTSGRGNILYVDDSEACGSAVVTVRDVCDQACEIGVRMTGGEWVLVENCTPEAWNGTGVVEVKEGRYWYRDDWCGPEGRCDNTCDGHCEAHTPPYKDVSCWVESSKTYEWVCE